MEIAFTIFTGTYNSEKIIHRVFKSIDDQVNRNFEWIIIDDCSIDNTVELLNNYKEKNPEMEISIYRNLKNRGVAEGRREALYKAKGKYFVTWDHDDEQSPMQLSIFEKLWKAYDSEKIGAINAKMNDQHGKVLGKLFPMDGFISDYISMHNTYLVGHKDSGNVVEHHVCVKTTKFKEVLEFYEANPDLLGKRRANGGDVWGMLAYLGYQTIYTNNTVRTYYINEAGRITMSSAKRNQNAERILRNKLLWVNFFDNRLPMAEWKWKLRNIFAVVMYGYLAKWTLDDTTKAINNNFKKVLAIILAFPAFLMAKKFARD